MSYFSIVTNKCCIMGQSETIWYSGDLVIPRGEFWDHHILHFHLRLDDIKLWETEDQDLPVPAFVAISCTHVSTYCNGIECVSDICKCSVCWDIKCCLQFLEVLWKYYIIIMR